MILGTRAAFTRRVHEYDDVHSFFFRPTAPVGYQAGQYTHLHLGGLPSPRSIRELSFTSAPAEEELRFTVHTGSGSAYKRKLDTLTVGDGVGMFRSGGHSALPATPDGHPRVLIGGGVGVVPFRSLVIDTAGDTVPLHVVQVQRSPDREFLFRGDFAAHAASYRQTQPESLDAAIAAVIADVPDALFLLCGSRRFTSHTLSRLQAKGIDRTRVTSEAWG